MSILDQRAVSAPTSYTISNIPAAQNLYLCITNDSPFELTYWFDNNQSDKRTLPPGAIVENEEPGMAAPSVSRSNGWSGNLTIQVAQPLGGTAPTNPPAQEVTVEVFSQPRKVNRFSLARVVNVGNSVSVGTSDILQGTGQQAGITTQDRNSVPNHYPTLIPAQAAAGGGQTDIALAPLDTNGLPLISAALTVKATETDITTPLFISAPIIEVGAVPTAGALGVAAVIAAPGPFAVTSIGLKTVLSIAPSANGLYRMSVHVLLNNLVSGNALTVSVSYKDAVGTNRSSNMTLIAGSTSVIAAGVTSMANGAWAGNSLTFYAATGANITLNYNDPNNTPNDVVNAVLERLA